MISADPRFSIGERVEKSSGYKWPGEIRAVFLTKSGSIRYVVECTVPEVAGALHIYSESQIARLLDDEGAKYRRSCEEASSAVAASLAQTRVAEAAECP